MSFAAGGNAYDNVLEAQGLSSSAVQAGLLKSKVTSLQSEIARLRAEVKDTNERMSQSSAKLNEQKMQMSALTNKYADAMARLSDTEASERRLEDALMAEQRQHQASRETFDRALEQHRRDDSTKSEDMSQLQSQIQQLQQQLSAKELSRNSLDSVAKEIAACEERRVRQCDSLVTMFNESLDRLISASDQDEASVFVARSACQSAVTELEGKLLSVEGQLEALQSAFRMVATQLEDDANAMTTSLMAENKDLWTHISRTQFELDKAKAESQQYRRRLEDASTGAAFRDQLALVTQQKQAADENLKRCQAVVEQQRDSGSKLEAEMSKLKEDFQVLR